MACELTGEVPLVDSIIVAALARARVRIGRETPAVRFAIERSDLRRYARACGETWPAYVNGDEAAPTFISSLQSEGMPEGLCEMDLPFTRLPMPDGVEPWRDIFSAGQSAGLIDQTEPVASLVARLADEFAQIIPGDVWRRRLY